MNTRVINGLNHICIYTKDVEGSYEFYHRYFDFECVYETLVGRPEEGEEFPFRVKMIRSQDLVLELIQPAKEAYVNAQVTGAINHVGFDVSDIEESVKQLRARGMEQISEISNMPDFYQGMKAVSLKGPSGENVSLYEFKLDQKKAEPEKSMLPIGRAFSRERARISKSKKNYKNNQTEV
ncbi:MAG: VOC family protein [Lachnospiraceae bacterium]|nr:VOC family protein [Lachnospiraceae bacterium]